MENSHPLVTVFMISYNQQDYIIEALENVLDQEVDFTYKVILSDDCSTDNTQQVVDDFLENHPKKDLVTFIKQEKNLGWMPNFIFTLQKCQESGAKYIAMCEGDDFWTNKHKLQKQIDLLEQNPEIVLACHRYKELYNDGSLKEFPYFRKDFFNGDHSFKFDQKDFEEFMRIQTMTIVFKTSSLDLSLRKNYKYYCDTHIKHHILDHGPGIYTKDFDAVYRIHGNNVFMSLDQRKKTKFSYDVYKDLIRNGYEGYRNLLNTAMRERITNELKNNKRNILDPYYRNIIWEQFTNTKSFPQLLKYIVKGTFN
ncbi:glycosyltransferase family 2 protein [Epilithonimonas caeni]|uniref:glycosyltransferase family 2 protein n=1 Tax=Epilithonimonas caeni TaxID=365343 RepID=UPI000686A502|nr:glycosyltransferase [Epilithonimonas caeni]